MTRDPYRSTGRLRAVRPQPPARTAAVIATIGLLAGLAGCGRDGDPPAPSRSPVPPASSAAPLTITPSTAPTSPTPPPGNVVRLDCYRDGSLTTAVQLTVAVNAAGKLDFAEAWAAKPRSCDVSDERGETEGVVPTSPVERAAYKASGYRDNDISTLYEICADVDPEDTYVEPGFTMSATQIAEITGAMKLCPKHPYARKWQAAVKRGKADIKLEAEGRLFGSGTYRVGKEIKAGTYATTDVDGCYWERQDPNGEIIDNNFITAAKRAQVTIRKSDYGFHTEGCGTWRPA